MKTDTYTLDISTATMIIFNALFKSVRALSSVG